MKILITGARGMLGQDLCSLLEKEHEIIKYDREELDITNAEMVDEVLPKLNPNAVINCAAFTDVDGCEEQTKKEIAMKVNGYGPGNLAKACAKLDIPFFHYSTDYIFNGQEKNGYKEDYDKIDPINAYGETKALGEKLIKENCTKYYILRTAWLYGKLGKNFVDTMLQLAQKNDNLRVVNDQHGKPTFTLDLAKRTKEILDQKVKPGIYHVTNEGEASWYDFANEIFKIKGVKIKVTPCKTSEFPRKAIRPEYSALINTKLPAMRKWQEALAEYLAN
ncbi:MAG: dTDP-4-dehydrorhamnose reductase [Patescibacteria group bacterium]|jgi:dTDP-4-dehydrorhamnose reductase